VSVPAFAALRGALLGLPYVRMLGFDESGWIEAGVTVAVRNSLGFYLIMRIADSFRGDNICVREDVRLSNPVARFAGGKIVTAPEHAVEGRDFRETTAEGNFVNQQIGLR
jgi:hypothetical protein